MKDTPRTDALAQVWERLPSCGKWVDAEFARGLERELTALAEIVERYDRTNDVRLADVVKLAHQTLAAMQAAEELNNVIRVTKSP